MDQPVTVFGGGGFLGRYVAQHLYKTGVRVRIAQRDPRSAYFLKPLSAVGQTQFAAVDLRDAERVAMAVAGSKAVINLIGILKGDFDAMHVEGARTIAAACRAAGVSSLVHISAIGVDPESSSAYGRSKGEGELAVRTAFPGATIIRPSILFGQEDNFVNRFARLARMFLILPVIRPAVHVQPVFVADVAKAVAAAALDSKTHAGTTYELGGPQILTMHELMAWICHATERRRALLDIPDPIGKALALLTGWLPGAPITWDEWMMLQGDNIVSAKAKGLKAFGIAPTPLAAVAEGWLTFYRRHGRFAVNSFLIASRTNADMDLLTVIILGIVEGVTEFIPVSSTGHLILASALLGYDAEHWRVFNIVIQLGAILAVIALYWRTFWTVAVGLVHLDPVSIRFVRNILVAFLPSAIIGLLLLHQVEALLQSPETVAVALIVGGVAILAIERLVRKTDIVGVADIPLGRVIGIGFIQCLAMIPGVSRSGATILGALALGVERRTAAEFSFFLAVPTMLGASTLELVKNSHEIASGVGASFTEIAIGFVISFVVAVVVVRAFVHFVSRHGFGPFAWYRIIAGTAALVWLLFR